MRNLLSPGAPDQELADDDLVGLYEVPGDAGPHLRLNFVTSPDGAATVAGLSAGLQTAGDNRIFGLLRDLADVVLVGAGTIRDEGYGALAPPAARRERRRSLGRAEVPVLAVVSNRLDLDPGAELFGLAPVRPVVITHGAAEAGRVAALREVAEVIVAGAESVDLTTALTGLAERGLPRVLCEGGPSLFGSLLAAGCVDELCLSVTPRLVGAGPRRIVAGPPLAAPVPMRLAGLLAEDGALFCRYTAG
jgi:riboflavin biosynthesis pyrimidine reductase